jgi:hypothetical protein
LYVWKVWRGIFEIVSLRDGFNLRQVVRLSSVGNRIHTFTNSTLSHYQSLLLTREESQPLKCPHVTVPLRMKGKTLFLHGAEFGRRRAEEGWLKIRLEFESLTSCTVQVILGLRKSTLVANNARCSKHKLKRNESDVGFTLGLIDGSNYNIIDSERSGGGGGGSDASDECEVMLERRSRRKRKGDCEGLLSMGPGPETNGLNEASDTSWQKLSEPNRTRRVRSSRSDTSTTLRVLEQRKQSDYLAMSDLIKFEHRSPEPSGETGAAEDRAGDLNARKERQRSKFSCDIDMLLTTETLNGIAVLAASSDMERYSVAIVFTQLQTNVAEGLSQACPMDNSNHGQASPVNRALGIAHGNMRTRELQLRSHIVLLDIEAQERTGTAIEASLQMEHLLKSGTEVVSGAMDEGKDNGSKPGSIGGDPARTPPPVQRTALTARVSEIVNVTDGGTFSCNEIYGLTLGQTAMSRSHANDEGASKEGEDCVICLSEAPTVILLPCRHLCVCSGCFERINLCPVCRAPFEAYLVRGDEIKLHEQYCGGGRGEEDTARGIADPNPKATSEIQLQPQQAPPGQQENANAIDDAP